MGVNDKIFLNWFTCVLLIFVYVISRINNLILPRPCKMNVVKFHKSTLRNCHLGEFSRRSRFYKDCRAQEKLIMVLHFMKLKQKTLGQIHTRIIASLTLLQMLGPQQHIQGVYSWIEGFLCFVIGLQSLRWVGLAPGPLVRISISVSVANVLEDPQVLWTAQGLHWGLTVSFSDYHLQDYCLKIQ